MSRRFVPKRVEILLLLTPFLAGSAVFVVLPMVMTLALSFTQYDIFSPPEFIGVSNYLHFFGDQLFQRALYNSVWFVLIAVTLRVTAALGLALALNGRGRALGLARSFVYLPTIVPDVAYALVWLLILNPGFGPLNLALSTLGLPTHAWLQEPFTARASIVVMWGLQLGEGLVLLLAARQLIPTELFESAALDGANRWQVFQRIILPLMAPALLLLTIRDTVLSFQGTFAPGLLTSDTGPYYSTYFLPHYAFDESFGLFKYGYGSAVTVVMYVLTALFIAVQFAMMRRWSRPDEI
ncbi:MAG: sugar ABC transporter permease [Anaerolineae bacterium]